MAISSAEKHALGGKKCMAISSAEKHALGGKKCMAISSAEKHALGGEKCIAIFSVGNKHAPKRSVHLFFKSGTVFECI